jgi:hypothetical protein
MAKLSLLFTFSLLAGLTAFTEDECPWVLTEQAVIAGFSVPESVLPVPDSDIALVSNIGSAKDEYWKDDGKGFISSISPDGTVINTRVRDSSEESVIHSPKGMAVLDKILYFTDNTQVKRCRISGGNIEVIDFPDAKKLNDIATDGHAVYISDTAQGVIHRLTPDRQHTLVKAPAGVNGVTFHKNRMFCVSWDAHDIYELDPSGKKEPRPFGLADHFVALDGIEALDDGSLIVSDFPGNRICWIAPDEKRVSILVEAESPADIGIDRERMLLYAPLFMENKVAIYRLEKK